MDETGFCIAVTSQVVLICKRLKPVDETGGDTGRMYITVLVCIAADGIHLPPYTVYKEQNRYAIWTSGGPPEALLRDEQQQVDGE